MKPDITAETWVVTLDGEKALIFRNEGFDDAPNLQLLEQRAHDHPSNRDLGSDRPGRHHDAGGASRSAVEEPDRHDLAEAAFVKDVAAWLEKAARAKKFERLVVFADPRSLGRLRDDLGATVRVKIVAERDADFTGAPLADIEKAFAALLAKAS